MSAIYIHIPFCKQSCFYCDFHFSTSLRKKEKMILALSKELEMRKDELKNEIVETIYFGGGTPSLLTLKELNFLIACIYNNYEISEKPEITLEANPDDLTNSKIKELSHSKINRLSIGIQSFFDQDLKMMHRAHNADEAKNSISMATRYFDNITIDLIYGIPKMSNQRWKENLQIAFDFKVPHISSYALTVEPKTVLDVYIKKGKYPNVDENNARKHFDILVENSEKEGFVQYETSNFGKPNYFSKHNTSYWLGKKYIGIGPSAHSFNQTHRSWNVANNAKYIKEISIGKLPNEVEKLSIKNRYNEYIMTGLRTIWGVSLAKIENDFGTNLKTHLMRSSQKYIDDGFLKINNNIITITKKGSFLADGIAADLFMI